MAPLQHVDFVIFTPLTAQPGLKCPSHHSKKLKITLFVENEDSAGCQGVYRGFIGSSQGLKSVVFVVSKGPKTGLGQGKLR